MPVCSPFFTRATSFQTCRCKFNSTWISLGREQGCSLTKGTGFRSTAPWSAAHYTGVFIFAITGMCRKQWEQGFVSWQSRGTKPSFTLNLYTCLWIVSRIARAMKIKLTLQGIKVHQCVLLRGHSHSFGEEIELSNMKFRAGYVLFVV